MTGTLDVLFTSAGGEEESESKPWCRERRRNPFLLPVLKPWTKSPPTICAHSFSLLWLIAAWKRKFKYEDSHGGKELGPSGWSWTWFTWPPMGFWGCARCGMRESQGNQSEISFIKSSLALTVLMVISQLSVSETNKTWSDGLAKVFSCFLYWEARFFSFFF